jgi:hypothetical protein
LAKSIDIGSGHRHRLRAYSAAQGIHISTGHTHLHTQLHRAYTSAQDIHIGSGIQISSGHTHWHRAYTSAQGIHNSTGHAHLHRASSDDVEFDIKLTYNMYLSTKETLEFDIIHKSLMN